MMAPFGPSLDALGQARDMTDSEVIQSKSPVVSVTTSTNVLAYPGSTMTRYEERQLLVEALEREQADAMEQIDEARSAGRALLAGDRILHLGHRLGELIDTYNALQPQTISADNGKLLWELGGIVRCGPSYLVALAPDRNGIYRVESWFDGPIWWGQEAHDIAKSLRELQTPTGTVPAEGPVCIVCRPSLGSRPRRPSRTTHGPGSRRPRASEVGGTGFEIQP